MSFSVISKSKNAIDIVFSDSKMIVFLEDGRELAVPLEWFPRLRKATESQLKKWRFIGKGQGIHWEEIDEDISIENLLE
jgi:hypothetical protein